MDIGIGLPNAVPGATGEGLLDWARRAEDAGFSSLASIGAVSYPSYEELTVFAAAGAVTSRIKFLSNVLIAPARSTGELAKQAATVDQLTGGRLTLGLGVGWRQADFALTGRDFGSRGASFDRQLEDLARAWAGEPLTDDTRPASPTPVQQPIPIVVGGASDAAVSRAVRHGVGWTAGGMPPADVAPYVEKVRRAWRDAGRDGMPRVYALVYFGLGDTDEESMDNMRDYYKPMGDELAGMIAASALRTTDAVREAISAYADVGVDELILDPTVADPKQVELLAEAALS